LKKIHSLKLENIIYTNFHLLEKNQMQWRRQRKIENYSNSQILCNILIK